MHLIKIQFKGAYSIIASYQLNVAITSMNLKVQSAFYVLFRNANFSFCVLTSSQ